MSKINFKFGKDNFEEDEPTNRQNNVRQPVHFEPLRTNRFVVYSIGVDIPENQITDFNVSMDTETFIELTIIETEDFIFDIRTLNNILGFTIEYLSPVGLPVGAINFNVIEVVSFNRNNSYSDDSILKSNFKFKVIIV